MESAVKRKRREALLIEVCGIMGKISFKDLFCFITCVSWRYPGPRQVPKIDELFYCNGYKLFHQDVRGLYSNFELITEFLTERKSTDILTLSETHTQDTDNFLVYDIPGFIFIRKSRKMGKVVVSVCILQTDMISYVQ